LAFWRDRQRSTHGGIVTLTKPPCNNPTISNRTLKKSASDVMAVDQERLVFDILVQSGTDSIADGRFTELPVPIPRLPP
jgi:hypothetical protein